ncbi:MULTISPECIES: saccharopine dehydrogenase NADP-binding domain-containing protein [unclassified Streptomyces]|uniref:saccharopine dehydrogenase family protein n=1 Tax=unclassified Streptomyces TaxID=2593676 RepID=UPI002E805110|nr:saccharopine dehydrogenase NADP-binding domain-containing protein [Streptomyces sp. NBC_00589]WTI35026.1 saccharopine dehydrogenase NADP-binding domain-containing protein [Streptomyces sp. NBC_00775]WUB31300.1 saccharopine dehydrogenase NADP-binding domain-containing protein [Streptomyces sp. NBC_00589]
MGSGQLVAVFGAYGHTGRFVVAELAARGFVPVPSGRNTQALEELAGEHGLEARVASVGDPASLDRALAGTAAVINCAGPFASTTGPVIEAALRAGIPYLDVAAELEANLDTFAHYRERARDAGAVIVPAMAFFGGLGDLLATAAMGDWTEADEAHIAYALSSWHPTAGTRLSGAVSRERRGDHRLRYSGGQWERRTDQAPTLEWTFPDPIGPRQVIGEFTMADVVTVPQHLSIPEVTTYMTAEAVRDIATPDTPAPTAADQSGRSDQTFLVDVVVRSGGAERRATAGGQDIYAVTAPLVAEALERVLTGRTKTTGVASAGQIFDAPDFLHALAPHITLDLNPQKQIA